MTIKTLLLGSAAAVAVVGGAQAADLSVAEPVEYVKVCDYFGTGYWYIPGTDTCIKISGYVEETAYFHEKSWSSAASHSSSWNFQNTVQMDIDTKSETEYGVLEGLISFGSGTSNYWGASRGNDYTLGDDGAFLSLGGFKAGTYQLAAWNPVYAVTDNHGTSNAELYATFNYDLLDTFQLSWASGGVSTSVAISDPSSWLGSYSGDSAALITGNVGFSAKDVSFQVSAGFVNTSYGGAWGIDGMAHFNLGKDDSFELNAAYGSNYFTVNTWDFGYQTNGSNDGWSVLGGWQHNLSKTLALQLVGSYADSSGDSRTKYALNADLVWSPVTNFSVTGALLYTGGNDFSSAWNASLSVKKSW